jgi:hypothetical protein
MKIFFYAQKRPIWEAYQFGLPYFAKVMEQPKKSAFHGGRRSRRKTNGLNGSIICSATLITFLSD